MLSLTGCYLQDGNESLDMVEVGAFWSDVFLQNRQISEAAQQEAIARACKVTFEQFDSITKDGKIDQEEFLLHLRDNFPIFPTEDE